MEYKGVLSFIVIFVTLLALIGVSRFVHQRISTTTQLCVQNHHLTLLRGLLLLFLGPEDLRPPRGTNNSSSLNGTTLPSNLMAGSFHLHSSDNFDAYLSEVITQFIKFLKWSWTLTCDLVHKMYIQARRIKHISVWKILEA